MPHDDSKTCERLFGDLGGHHLMAPLFVSLNKTLPWSPCSALYVTEFFDNGHGEAHCSLLLYVNVDILCQCGCLPRCDSVISHSEMYKTYASSHPLVNRGFPA